MNAPSRIFGAMLFLVVAVNSGTALGSDEPRTGPLAAFLGEHGSYAIPPNYRELIARYYLALARSEGVTITQEALRTARIAKPYNVPDGLFGRLTGTTIPTVCVTLDGMNADDIRRRSAFGELGKAYAKFLFEDGKPRAWPPNPT
jgi:hypothetical protein